MPPSDPPGDPRRVTAVLGDLARWLREHGVPRAKSAYAALGLAFTVALVGAGLALWLFVALAGEVAQGETLALDRAVLGWIHARRAGWLDVLAVEVTSLGSSVVVLAIAALSAAFLAALRRRAELLTLVAAVSGGFILSQVLKLVFHRDRPDVFEWLVSGVPSASFPSGHALDSAVLFTTLAYILAQLGLTRGARRATFLVAGLAVVAVALSRLYLGVHYPTDVAAGIAVGYAWAMVCVVAGRAIEAVRARGDA